MWFSFWKSKDRFSLQELRYLTDQLMKIQIVNEVNKDFVIEALRSIAELLTYGDQHDSSFFEFFMEKQVMGEFLRILKISRPVAISVQLLQTISIIVQNLKTEHAIYYMFGSELINYLITYSFDFNNEELLSYYISFLRFVSVFLFPITKLYSSSSSTIQGFNTFADFCPRFCILRLIKRAISVKLNKNTISLLVKTQDDEVVSFPLYVEAIRFAFHEENMIRIAVRAVTLNVYHVGDESVNRYISSPPHGDYFSNLVTFFQKQCLYLNGLVLDTAGNPGPVSTSTILTTVDEIDDNLYYLSDVISAGIPDVGRLITDNILLHLIFPLLLPSLRKNALNEKQMGAVTSLYLLCSILRIVKIKDLANTVCVAFFCPLEAFSQDSEVKPNGCMTLHGFTHESRPLGNNNLTDFNAGASSVQLPNSYHSCDNHPGAGTIHKEHRGSCLSLRDVLLSYIINGDDVQVLGSLSFLATLLQTKELDESMLDALGILPRRKQHKKLLLQALVGEGSGEEQLFSPESSLVKDFSSELDGYVRKLKEYGVLYSFPDVGASPHVHRFQVLDALVSLFCRSSIPAETLWHGGWLLRQLLPCGEAEFNSSHLRLLQDSYKNSTSALLKESRGMWPDLVISVLSDEWSRCKRAIEAPSPRKEPKCILMPTQNSSSEYVIHPESSFASGEQMRELVKVFVLLHQLQMFSLGRALLEQPPILPSAEVLESFRAKASGVDFSGPKPGSEIRLVDALPCRVAFERGKERHFHFLAVSVGSSGWMILAEELPLKQHCGVVRVAAPLAGSNPQIDSKHLRWLHLRIRPSILPFMDPAKLGISAKASTKPLVDGRWTLAFRDEDSCKSALSMILEEINLQSNEVERRLKLLFDLEP